MEKSNEGLTVRPSALTIRSDPPLRLCASTVRFYYANLQLDSAFTHRFADLVDGAVSPRPKNYSYDSFTHLFLLGVVRPPTFL